MNFLYVALSFLLFLVHVDHARAHPPLISREKRSAYPFTLGHMILRIHCADTIVNTVCAPGGTQDCPRGYRGEENRGACGFATLAHFFLTGNIAGTCCIRDTSLDNNGQPTKAPTTTQSPASSSKTPHVVVYGVPVWAGYNGLPSYGQSSPYQQGGGNSALYSIEAMNAPIAAPANGYQLGSRTPDFKVTELKAGSEVRK